MSKHLNQARVVGGLRGLFGGRRRTHAAAPPLRQRVAARTALAAVVLTAGFLSTGTAGAAVVRIAGQANAVTYMGVENFNGVVGVCSGNGRATPTVVTGPNQVYAPTSAWALNAVMNADGSNLDNTTGAAIATIVKNDGAVPSNHSAPTPNVNVQQRVNEIVAQANMYAGLRTIPLSLSDVTPLPLHGMNWQVGGVGIQAPGGWMPGRAINLTANGPVVFEATGTNSITVTSTTSPQTLNLRSTGNGLFQIAASTTVPSNNVNSHPAQGAGYQMITTRVGDEPLNGQSDPGTAVFDFYPQAVTNTSVITEARPGVKVHDKISVTGAKPNSSLTGRSTLYGPLPVKPSESATAPAGTPVVGTAEFELTVDANGAGEVETTELTLPAAGYYVWQEEIDGDPDDAPSPKNFGFQGNYGVGTETTVITPTPDIITQVNAQEVLVGQPISDTVTVVGTMYDNDGRGPISNQMTGRLYGPVDPIEGRCDDVDWSAAPIAHEFGPIAVTSAQQYFTGVGEFTPAVKGCYSYGETLRSLNSQGTEIWVVEHEAGRATQTTLAQVPEAATQINSAVVKPGEYFSDTVAVTGTAGNAGTFEATLWGPVAPDPELGCWYGTDGWADLIASGEAKVFHTESVPFVGDGEFTTSNVPVTDLGCYTWSESFEFDNLPDVELETPPGEETETGIVAEPAIATVAKATSPYLGSTFSDVITLTGTQNLPGEITGDVLVAAPVKGACDDVDWSTNGKVHGQIDPIATTADGTFDTSGLTVDGDRAICATFAITWTPVHDKLIDAAAVDPAGLPSETALFVPQVPAVPAGEPGESSALWLVLGLLLLSGGGAASVWTVRRRKVVEHG